MIMPNRFAELIDSGLCFITLVLTLTTQGQRVNLVAIREKDSGDITPTHPLRIMGAEAERALPGDFILVQ